MKKVRLLLGIGAFAAGALALYYFAKKKESATVQTMGPNEDSMKKEPTVSVEDRANVEETFGDYKATEVTEADTQETRETEAASETESESAVALAEGRGDKGDGVCIQTGSRKPSHRSV